MATNSPGHLLPCLRGHLAFPSPHRMSAVQVCCEDIPEAQPHQGQLGACPSWGEQGERAKQQHRGKEEPSAGPSVWGKNGAEGEQKGGGKEGDGRETG